MDIFNFLGRFHPILLHLPIGFLLLAFAMEVRDRYRAEQTLRPAIGFSLFWGMWGAIGAAATGYMLADQGGYEEVLLSRHQWLGISVAVLSVVLYMLHRRRTAKTGSYYFPVFVLTTLALLITGHLGGSLTHGSDFVSPSHLFPQERARIADLNRAVVFADFIQPILDDKCVSCHSEAKKKGDLLLHSMAGLEAGGKNGAVLVQGNAQKSMLVERMHLPLDDEDHMPPKGKQQTTKEEIRLIEWWIDCGADYAAKVAECELPEDVQEILDRLVQPADGVLALDVSPASQRKLAVLEQAGIGYSRLHADSPFLGVDLSRKDSLNAERLDALTKVKKQLIALDLSYTQLKTKDLEVLASLPHLRELSLQQSAVNDTVLQYLSKHNYLEYLNLYGTQVSDAGIALLAGLPRLQKLFLWQSAVTEEGIEKLRAQKPGLYINHGLDKELFGDAQLKPPLIVASQDLFEDSLQVELQLNMSDIEIRYTLDGTAPDSSSILYTGTFTIDQSAKVQAIATKTGWQASPLSSRQFVKIRYKPQNVVLAKAPHERYAGKGGRTLIDLAKGSTLFTDGMWLGYEKEHMTATLDLGKTLEVSSVSVGALQGTSDYIFYPKGMEVSVSKDGKNFRRVATAEYPTAEGPVPRELATFTENFSSQPARYVRVKVLSNLTNPAWHEAPGAPCWIFVDEILVE